jgi:hypothetical protein
MDDDTLWPPIDEALLKKLDATFPDKCPDITDQERKIWMDAGARKVVLMLRAVYLEQQELA